MLICGIHRHLFAARAYEPWHLEERPLVGDLTKVTRYGESAHVRREEPGGLFDLRNHDRNLSFGRARIDLLRLEALEDGRREGSRRGCKAHGIDDLDRAEQNARARGDPLRAR